MNAMPWRGEEFFQRLEYHRDHPGSSLEQYTRRHKLALAREVLSKRRIYMDTNFWLRLRDVYLGRPRSAVDQELYRELAQLVRDRVVVCPISDRNYIELVRQSDEHTRLATARLIDQFSLGSAIEPLETRMGAEALHFLQSRTAGAENVYPTPKMIWTKAAYLFGFFHPMIPGVPESEMVAFQKAAFDIFWDTPLIEVVTRLSKSSAGLPGEGDDGLAQLLNEGKQANPPRSGSFRDLFLDELSGMLDSSAHLLVSVMEHLYHAGTGNTMTREEKESAVTNNLLGRMIYNVIRLKLVHESELPTFRIYPGLHAAIRWDQKRNYKANDFVDLGHASAAIPYFDVFLTEHSLCHLIQSRRLAFDKTYKVSVASTAEDALKCLRAIERSS